MKVGSFTARIYHKEQPKVDLSQIKCNKCFGLGHRASDCVNPIKCRECGREGHTQGEGLCDPYESSDEEYSETYTIIHGERDQREGEGRGEDGSVDERQSEEEDREEDQEEEEGEKKSAPGQVDDQAENEAGCAADQLTDSGRLAGGRKLERRREKVVKGKGRKTETTPSGQKLLDFVSRSRSATPFKRNMRSADKTLTRVAETSGEGKEGD